MSPGCVVCQPNVSRVNALEAALSRLRNAPIHPKCAAFIGDCVHRRAGLTERSFFRYFADKREVLFYGQEGLRKRFVETIAGSPALTAPFDALEAASELFEERRDSARARNSIIAAHPELQERELIEFASLGAAIADALRARGVTEPAAGLMAAAAAEAKPVNPSAVGAIRTMKLTYNRKLRGVSANAGAPSPKGATSRFRQASACSNTLPAGSVASNST